MNFIAEMAEKLEFPAEASVFLGECFEKMLMTEGVISELYKAMDSFFCENDNQYLETVKSVSEKSGVGFRSSVMVLLLMSAKPLYYTYKQNKLSDNLFFDTMADLKYNLLDCKKLYGEWGVWADNWFRGHYKLRLFKLGRLQYEKYVSDFSYKGFLKPGDPLFSCHIPSFGSFDEASVKESFRMAYRFYKDSLVNGKLVVCCNSWLLYPPIIEKLRETSNLRKFYNIFDVVKTTHDHKNSDFWRIFNVEYSPEVLDTVTADNSLKKVVLDQLKNGGTMGEGLGFVVVDESF